MSANASFVSAPAYGVGAPTAADTNRDSSATVVEIVVAGSTGSRIERIEVQSAGPAASAASANVLRFWIYSGAAWYLFRELAVATFTPSATVAGYANVISFPNGLMLEPLMKLGCTVHTYAGTQDKYVFHAIGGDL